MIDATMSDRAYHAHPAIGSTTAKLALKSLRLMRDRIDGIAPSDDCGYFQIGRLLHMQRLEPDRFAELVTDKGPINEKTGKPYGRDTLAFARWQDEHPGVTVVEPWIYLAFERCPDAVCELFTGGDPEVSAIVNAGTVPGYEIKCRCDYLRGAEITDLKSCVDVDDAERQIRRLSYWFSAAWYRAVMRAETGRAHSHRFVFVEKRPPFRWRIVNLAADYALYADAVVDDTMNKIADAYRTGDWSDTGELEVMAGMPEYLDDADTDGDEEAA